MHPNGCSQNPTGPEKTAVDINSAMVGVTKIQRGNANYWLQAVAQGEDDYYTHPGEAPGEWVGSLADQMGLAGEVDPEGYAAILEGRDPTSGDQLVRRPPTRVYTRPDGSERRAEPVLGYDVRFSAPKSVSLIYAIGDEGVRARVIAVMNEAVRAGIKHLEAEACMVQRGKGGTRIERGEGFVGMAFRHRMSRAGDPALHTHVLVSNMTRAASDGRWLTLASPKGRSPLWPHGKSAGVVFQAQLRAGFLREFGLEFNEPTNGYADLKAIPREAIEAFSTRSREIATWLESHGVEGLAAAQTAAYRTRANKDYGVDADKRRAEWIEQGEPFGLTPQRIGELVSEARPREPRALREADVDAALTKLEETSSHFDRRALLWAIADEVPEGAELSQLGAAVDRLLASDRVVCVHASRDLLDLSHYTTPRLAEIERRFTAAALEGQEAGVAQVSRPAVEAVLARHDYLGADQRELVLRLTTAGEAITPVAAWPGTGKTTALAAAREAWEEAGVTVIGVATARTASGELTDAGVPATSIRALLLRAEEWQAFGTGLARGTVILVDEASTASTPDLEALRELAAACGGKLVLIGDPRQIGAIGPGGMYAHVTRAIEPARLEVIRRQHREADRELVALVHEGRGSDALDLLRARGRLIVGDDLPSTLGGLLTDWHRDFASGADAVMIARRNRDVVALNEGARALRSADGGLGSAEVIVGERPFAAGDRVQTRVNAPGVDNRERWDITAVDAAARRIELRRVGGDGRSVVLGPDYLDSLTPDGHPSLQYAYAVTKFGSQAQTFDRAYPLLDAGANLEQELVAISRGREVANVYVVASSELLDPDLGPAKRELSDRIHDIRDSIERQGADYSAVEVALRHKVDALDPAKLARRRAELNSEGRAADPELARRDRLDRAISDGRKVLKRLRGEREAIEAMREPPPGELAWAQAGEANAADALQRRLAERAGLPERAAQPKDAKPTDPRRRLEAVLVEERVERLARLEVAAGRVNANEVLYKALGPFPADDAAKALAWGRAAHSIALYRVRHGVRDQANVLGPRPRSAAARAERSRAQRRIAEAQRHLGRTRDKGAQREAAKTQAIGR